MSRRREDRVSIALPVRIWGMDALDRPFTQSAVTTDISRLGARLKGVACCLKRGDIIGMQHGTEKARFRVVWVPDGAKDSTGQIGVHSIEPGRYLWGTPLRELAQRACTASARTQINAPAGTPEGRRGAERYACRGGAEYIILPNGMRQWGTLFDISSTGCYIETHHPLNANASVELRLTVMDIEIRCSAGVRTSHPRVGMGLAFGSMSREDGQRLQTVLQLVAGPYASRVPAARAGQLSERFERMKAELAEIEALAKSACSGVHPRLIAELRKAIEHTSQIAGTVQQWAELKEQLRDPFPIYADMEEQRIHNANMLICDLLNELEGTMKAPAIKGLDKLTENVRQLSSRLSRISSPFQVD